MELFYQACEVAATGSEVVMMLYFVSKFLGCRYQGWQNRIFQFLSFFVIFNYMMIVDKIFLPYNAVKDFVVMLLYILYALLLTKGARLYQIILPAAGIIMIAGINISVHEILSAMFHLKAEQLLEEQNNLRVAALFITKFLFFLLTQVVLNRVHLKKAKFRKKEFFSIFIVFFVSAVMMIYMFQFQYNSKQVNIKRFVMVFYVGIILINICVLPLLSMLAERNQKELQYTIMQTQLEEQKKTYDALYTVYHNLQILQHDMKNELLCVQKAILDDDQEKAVATLERLTREKITNFRSYVKTQNDLVDMVLNIKLNYAKEKGILVSCLIDTDFAGFDADDLVNLLANSLDNAIESSLQQKKRKEIAIAIKNKRNYLWIEIKNAISSSVLQKNAKLLTTKANRKYHGFGTESIRNLVEKYDGGTEYYEKDGWFVLDIMMRKSV